ncbi:shikimate kinase [Eubacterium ruminantium]|nr:shikimate kinase [Eubacterium ruminantium]
MIGNTEMIKENIVLIGMPASGKSTVGVILAKVLGMNFIDSDIVIQQREGARLSELIEKYGVDGFLAREEAAIIGIDVSNTVIATGGSAVYSDKAMKHLGSGAKVVYLKVGLDELKKRLSDISGRGVVLKAGETLETIYEIRTKLYEKYADIIVSEEGDSIESTVRMISDAL